MLADDLLLTSTRLARADRNSPEAEAMSERILTGMANPLERQEIPYRDRIDALGQVHDKFIASRELSDLQRAGRAAELMAVVVVKDRPADLPPVHALADAQDVSLKLHSLEVALGTAVTVASRAADRAEQINRLTDPGEFARKRTQLIGQREETASQSARKTLRRLEDATREVDGAALDILRQPNPTMSPGERFQATADFIDQARLRGETLQGVLGANLLKTGGDILQEPSRGFSRADLIRNTLTVVSLAGTEGSGDQKQWAGQLAAKVIEPGVAASVSRPDPNTELQLIRTALPLVREGGEAQNTLLGAARPLLLHLAVGDRPGVQKALEGLNQDSGAVKILRRRHEVVAVEGLRAGDRG